MAKKKAKKKTAKKRGQKKSKKPIEVTTLTPGENLEASATPADDPAANPLSLLDDEGDESNDNLPGTI